MLAWIWDLPAVLVLPRLVPVLVRLGRFARAMHFIVSAFLLEADNS